MSPMRSLISEFSYGYALTEELASGEFGPLVGAPIFPSLLEEGRPGGGYDLRLPLAGMSVFLQFKLSDRMRYRSAAEWRYFDREYYRMHLRPRRHSQQHQMLCDLENGGETVFYVAPYFYKAHHLNRHYLDHSVGDWSIWIPPLAIGPLPDDHDHYVAFARNKPAYFCSSNPIPIKALNKNQVIGQIANYQGRKQKIDREFFTKIVNKILDVGSDATDLVSDFKSDASRNTRRETLEEEAIFAAFLSRSILNAELVILDERSIS